MVWQSYVRHVGTMRYLLLAGLCLTSSPLHAQNLSGPAEVLDGDSLRVSGSSVRLFGIDAPEGKQTCNRAGLDWRCGEEAAAQLRNMIGGARIDCRGRGTDPYGRTVSVCSVAGIELNEAMVDAGWATAFRKYSQDYVAQEARAKAAKRGIWDSDFVLPEDYRAAQLPRAVGSNADASRQPARQSTTPISGCVIKGNRNRKGQWIYHLPGMPYYEVTNAEEMFCSEAQAQAAGYRRAFVR